MPHSRGQLTVSKTTEHPRQPGANSGKLLVEPLPHRHSALSSRDRELLLPHLEQQPGTHVQVEDGCLLVLCIAQHAAVNSVHNGAGVPQLETGPHAVPEQQHLVRLECLPELVAGTLLSKHPSVA